jgi:hypothetical protein
MITTITHLLWSTAPRRTDAGPRLGRPSAFLLLSACALLAGLGPAMSGRAASTSPTLIACAADLEHITGGQIEIRVDPLFFPDRSLPLICRRLDQAFREAAADPEIRQQLDHLVRVIDIGGLLPGNQVHFVFLNKRVLTIQMINSIDAVDSLPPLIVEVMKKVAHRKATGQYSETIFFKGHE